MTITQVFPGPDPFGGASRPQGKSVFGHEEQYDHDVLATDAEVAAAAAAHTGAGDPHPGYVLEGVETINAANHATLAAALAAAAAGDTVILTANLSGAGVTVPADVTLDLGGNTYTKSSGTTGVTLSDRSKVRNGTISVASGEGVGFAASTDASAANVKVVATAPANGFTTGAATRPTMSYCSSDSCYYGLLLQSAAADALVVGGTHRLGTANTAGEGSIYIIAAVRAKLVGVTVESAVGHGAWIGGSGVDDITLTGCVFRGNGTAGAADWRGVTVDSSAERIKFDACSFLDNYEAGVLATSTVIDVSFHGCTAKGNNTGLRSGGHGFEVNAKAALLTGCQAIGQLGNAANEGCGFYVPQGHLADCLAEANYSAGYRFFDALKASATGCVARNNSQRGVGNHDGFELSGTSVGSSLDIVLTGCTAYDDQGTKTQRYGINVASTNVNAYVVVGCNTRGNQTGGLNDLGGATKAVANNI